MEKEDDINENERERWKTIPWANLYEISSFGKLRTKKTRHVHNQNQPNRKYLVHNVIDDNGKIRASRAHRLVALAFLPNPAELPCVTHLDRNNKNNRVDNLKWSTMNLINKNKTPQNVHVNPMKVNQFTLDGKFIKTWNSVKEIVQNLGCDVTTLYRAASGERKTAHGFKWEYCGEIFENEEWKLIPLSNIKYNYWVSTKGRIKRDKGKRITMGTNANGYRSTRLVTKDGAKKKYMIHQLVLLAFNGPPPTDKHVPNHKDGNKSNNIAENLEYSTRQENSLHAHRTGLHPISRAVIGISRSSGRISFYSVAEAARKMGVTANVMRWAVKKNNSRFGYTWHYAEDLHATNSSKKRKRGNEIMKLKTKK